jgi:hypothetical protein
MTHSRRRSPSAKRGTIQLTLRNPNDASLPVAKANAPAKPAVSAPPQGTQRTTQTAVRAPRSAAEEDLNATAKETP